jgi:hypothetical protein
MAPDITPFGAKAIKIGPRDWLLSTTNRSKKDCSSGFLVLVSNEVILEGVRLLKNASIEIFWR